MDEERWIQKLRDRDQEAFRLLVSRFQPMLGALARQLFDGPSDLQDHAQEVFERVYNHIPAFRGNSGLGTWVYRIALNTALEMKRKEKTRKQWQIVQSFFSGMTEVANSESTPSHKMEEKEQRGMLNRAIHNLPEKQRMAFVLTRIDGLTYAEVALILGISPAAVDSLTQRAKSNLRKNLSEYYHDFK